MTASIIQGDARTLHSLERHSRPLTFPWVASNEWIAVSKKATAAVAMFDRHYSRQTPGGEIGPPGRKLVLMTADSSALWCSHWPDPAYTLDNLDAYRCVVFRNEGEHLSSELIRSAVRHTEDLWGPPPRDGWVTFVKVGSVASPNPGFCFKMAGWALDREWHHVKLVRLRA